jgi:hypothetical protein
MLLNFSAKLSFPSAPLRLSTRDFHRNARPLGKPQRFVAYSTDVFENQFQRTSVFFAHLSRVGQVFAHVVSIK